MIQVKYLESWDRNLITRIQDDLLVLECLPLASKLWNVKSLAVLSQLLDHPRRPGGRVLLLSGCRYIWNVICEQYTDYMADCDRTANSVRRIV